MKFPILFSVISIPLFVFQIEPANAAVVSIYDYMASKPTPFSAQTGSEPWTFHNGDETAALLAVGGSAQYGFSTGTLGFFTPGGDVGASGTGSAGTNEAPGLFIHTASDRVISAVLNIDSPTTIEAIQFTHELVINGNQGNGIDCTIRTVRGGSVVNHQLITILNTTSQITNIPLDLSDQDFEPGDKVVAIFSNRGSFLFDHGWFDIKATVVPEPSSILLLSFGVIGLMKRKRRS